MPNYVTIGRDELTVGERITAWWNPDGNSGQGGTVADIGVNRVHLLAGNPETKHEISFFDVHHFTVERFLDADECVEYHQGDCSGVVDYCYAPSGSNIPRCVHHNDKRWRQHDADRDSLAHHADSDVAPEWFHGSWGGANEFGEHWDID